jgi:hypothetical protein
MAWRPREKKSIHPQGGSWKQWGPPAAVVLVLMAWLAYRLSTDSPAPRPKPTAPSGGEAAKAPAPAVKGSKGGSANKDPDAYGNSKPEAGPDWNPSPSTSGGPLGDDRVAERDQWLARWFPSLAKGARPPAAPGQPTLTPSPVGSPGELAELSGKDFGLKAPDELVSSSGGSGERGSSRGGKGPGGGSGPGGGGKGPGGGGGSGGISGGGTFLDDAWAEKNKEIANDFRERARLEIPIIPGTQYLLLDLDDGFEGVNIYNPLLGINVSILAYGGLVSQALLEAFLGEGQQGVPALTGVVAPSSLGAPTMVPATAGSGLKDAKAWQFTSNGRTVQLALMERIDAQGTYLGIVNAPGENVTNAEDFYTKYFEQLKAN